MYDSTHVTKPDIAKHVEWLYEDGTRKPFDATATPVVETAYEDWLGNKFVDVRAVKSGAWIYQIDFNKVRNDSTDLIVSNNPQRLQKMEQVNAVHPSHTVRNIKRVHK